MITKFETRSSRSNKAFWFMSIVLAAGFAAANYHFAYYGMYVKFALVITGMLSSSALLIKTNEIRQLLCFWQESCEEVKKINWATKQEVIQTCLAIFVMVIVMGILLWSADSLLVWIMNKSLLGGA